MFNFNSLDLQEETFCGSKIYTMDNVFINVEKTVKFLDVHPPKLHKANETPSFNNIHFVDRRHQLRDNILSNLQQELSTICQQEIASKFTYTNYMKFLSKNFNNYRENFWGPHRDSGYTCIIYLDTFEGPGTNLYEAVGFDQQNCAEHVAPWRSRNKYKVIKTFVAKQNRLIMFNGKKFLHGMAIENNYFFTEERKNLAMFFRG